MSKPFDATLKELLEDAPESWPILVGRPGGAVTVVDSDIGTVTGAADKVLRVSGPPAWLLHVEAQAGPDASLPMRAQVYNTLLAYRHGLPVHTMVLLLRPEANLSIFNGLHEVGLPRQEPYLRFRYQVVRVWQEPPERFLVGAGTAPLAPISNVRQDELPAIVEKVGRRIRSVRDKGRRGQLWSSVKILLGLRYPVDLVERLLVGVKGMKESSTYRAILAEGEAKGQAKGVTTSRKILLALGRKLFGEPSEQTLAALNSEVSLPRLLELSERADSASSWEELFPPAPAGSSTRRRKRRSP